ncbi:hypothetical protein M0R45_025822 [Rubus argutus]|uniref:Uncharacterized protein n=1 Tax=Rubus argutus TaxID=59490 RepID=A0AAW1WX62_RUBAR
MFCSLTCNSPPITPVILWSDGLVEVRRGTVELKVPERGVARGKSGCGDGASDWALPKKIEERRNLV